MITFTLPAKCRVGTVTIRKTFGRDEAEASLAAENNGSDARDELIDLSIVKVDGEPCLPGNSGYADWPSKTRSVVSRFFKTVNDTNGRELLELIRTAEDEGTTINPDGNVETRYEFPENCDLEYVVLREMMEADERAAAASGKNISEAMVSLCVVETNLGKSFKIEDLTALGTRTRNIISTYWTGMNIVPEDELAPLIRAAMAVNEAASPLEASAANTAEDSSQSGSGSQAPAGAA